MSTAAPSVREATGMLARAIAGATFPTLGRHMATAGAQIVRYGLAQRSDPLPEALAVEVEAAATYSGLRLIGGGGYSEDVLAVMARHPAGKGRVEGAS